jgi:hypothetical protein
VDAGHPAKFLLSPSALLQPAVSWPLGIWSTPRKELSTTQLARLEGLELFPPAIVFIAPGHDKAAQLLSDVAIQPGSGLDMDTTSPQSATNWRRVITKTQGELEPVGLNLSSVPLHAVEVDSTMAD